MMNFEEFQIYVKNHIVEYLPDDCKEVDVFLHETMKNNGLKLSGIIVKEKDKIAAPTIYLDDAFERYKSGEKIENILVNLAKVVDNNRSPQELEMIMDMFKDFDKIKNQIIMVVINKDLNEEYLKDVPHTVMTGDLAVIYKVKLNSDMEGMPTCTITEQHKKMWGVSTEELHTAASENSNILMPSKVMYMEDMLSDIMGYDSKEEAMIEHPELFDIPGDKTMIVITNEEKLYGATAIFDDRVLEKVREVLGDDFMLLPSSIHECIAVKANMEDIETLENMVREINSAEVSQTDKLSDHVYMYDSKTKEIVLANESVRQAMVSENNSQYKSEDMTASRPRRSR